MNKLFKDLTSGPLSVVFVIVLLVLALVGLTLSTPVDAATNSLVIGSSGTGYSYRDAAYVYAPNNVLDLSETAVVSNDTTIVLGITAGSYVSAVSWSVETAVTNAAITFDIGDSDSATTWISGASATNTGSGSSALSVSATGPQSTNLTVTVGGQGKYYASDDEILLDFNLDPGETGKVNVKAHLFYSPDRD